MDVNAPGALVPESLANLPTHPHTQPLSADLPIPTARLPITLVRHNKTVPPDFRNS